LLFELDKYDRSLHRQKPAVPKLPYEFVSGIQWMSLLYWAEHCVECAAPSCYQSCDLYQPRTDVRCRRFTFGALKNPNFPSLRGYGVEVSFKKWAKLEAYGNLRLSSLRNVFLGETLVEWSAPATNLFGKIMARLTNKLRWNAVTHEALEELVRRLHQKRPKGSFPDAFLLEIYNPTDEVIRLQLSFTPISGANPSKSALVQLSRSFRAVIVCPLGYSRHQFETALFRQIIETDHPFLISIIPETDNNARLVFLTAEFVKFAESSKRAETNTVKCLVLDLDNTLWNGVLIENDRIVLQQEIISLLKQLDERGILLSIASKNDYETAWKKLEEFGIAEYFLYPQISWNPKSQSIRTVAERLNIGLDGLAFVDDNPFELDEVSRVLPEVTCVNAREIASLLSDPRFQGSATPDSRRRRHLYQEAAAREAAQESFGSDYLGFLSSCEIHLEVAPYSQKESERVAELVQRTNQLNFSGCKYTRDQLDDILSNPRLDKFVLKSSDRFGSYGTVGLCIVERTLTALCVQDFMLSCRVQSRLLERAFFSHLMEHHNPDDASHLWVNFRPTTRNKPARQVLESLGFRECDFLSSGFSQGMSCTSFECFHCDVVQVHCSTPTNQPVAGKNPNREIGVAKHEHL
jgi:FkbH-like protein